MGPTCRRQFPSPVRALSLSLYLTGPVCQCRAIATARPLFSLCAVGLSCQFRLLRARRGPARAHSRTSPGFSATMPAHASSSLFGAPPVPPRTPSLSLALCPRRQTPPETRACVPDHSARRRPPQVWRNCPNYSNLSA
jgi:hypothetical protein